MCRPAILRGFPVSVADVGDRVRLCHPLLSFEDSPALYVANRLDWENDPDALTVVDPGEASTLGTLLPSTCIRPISSGQGVVAVGEGFVQIVAKAGIVLDSEIRFSRMDGLEYRIGVATPALYAALRTRLGEEAREAFDEAMEEAVSCQSNLSDEGNAALFVMRKCSPGPRDDLAIRQLAGALQNQQDDLYRRLLVRFAFELNTQERTLHERVQRQLAMVYSRAADLYRLLHNRYIPELDMRTDVFGGQVQLHIPAAVSFPKVYDLARSGASVLPWSQGSVRVRNRAAPESDTRDDLNDQNILVKKPQGASLVPPWNMAVVSPRVKNVHPHARQA